MKTKKRKKPLIEQVGNIVVKIYPRIIAGKYKAFEVADYSKGFRKLRVFSDEAKARREAKAIANALSRGDVEAAQIRGKDAASYGRAIELIRATGVPLELAAAHYAEAFTILGGDKVVEAARDFARRHPKQRELRTVQQVADEMVAMKEKRKKGERYIEDLRGRLKKFAERFAVDVATVTGPDVQRWLNDMDAAPRTVKNFRSNVSQLFKYAESMGYICRGENPVAQTESIKTKSDEAIEIYTPVEITRLLAAAPDWFKPILALQAFAGLRSAEVAKLDWQDIDQAKGHIIVAAHKAKTKSRRLVPILPNLAKWLANFAKSKGKVYKHGRAYFHEVQREVAEATEIKADEKHHVAAVAPVRWKHNALRHSFISYRLAEIQNAAQVALEAGNSPGMIFQHYRELVTKDDAVAWFAVSPALPANITPIAKGAQAA